MGKPGFLYSINIPFKNKISFQWFIKQFKQILNNNTMKKAVIFSLLVGIMFLISCNTDKDEPTISMTPNKSSLAVGEEIKIELMVEDESGIDNIGFHFGDFFFQENWTSGINNPFTETITYTLPIVDNKGDTLVSGRSINLQLHAKDSRGYIGIVNKTITVK
jgi:hypothetical protein